MVWFTAIIATLLLVFSFLLYFLLERTLHKDIQAQLEIQTKFIYENFLHSFEERAEQHYHEIRMIEFVIFRDQEIVYSSQAFPLQNLEIYQENSNSFYVYKAKNDTEDAVLKTEFDTPYKGEIIVYLKEINDTAERVEEVLFYLNPILLLLLIWIGSNTLDKILIPLKKLSTTLQKTSILEIPDTIPITQENQDDEIGDLITSYNQMIQRLRHGIDTLKYFNQDLSHELKTPLTVLSAEIDLCLRKPREIDYYNKSFETMKYEISQMQRIIEQLLLFTSYTEENIQESFELCSLDSIFIDVISQYEKKAKEKNINLHIETIESIQKKLNPSLLRIILSNVIDNAIKYTPANKNIYLSLISQNKKAVFIIKDEGIGIQKEELPKIIEKFYRVDSSRNKKIEGFGLGLALVNNFVTLHKATLHIDSQPQEGTTVTLRF